jgi:hypothetical protein
MNFLIYSLAICMEIEKRMKILYSYNDAILSYNTYNEFINEKIKPRLL